MICVRVREERGKSEFDVSKHHALTNRDLRCDM